MSSRVANITLTPKQTNAWEHFEDPKIKELGFGGGAGGGKGITLNTLVLTNNGWKKAKDVSYTDKLVSIDGDYTDITGIFPQGIKQTYRITFDDGISIETDNEHLWKVWSADHGHRDGWRVKSTETLYNEKGRHSIPLLEKPFIGSYKPSYDPYILGYIIGDGTMTGQYPTIYTADDFIVNYLEERGWNIYSYKENIYQCHKSSDNEDIYKELPRVSGKDKYIPKSLLNATAEARLSLLKGLMDSDGYVDKDGSCSFSTMSEKLAKDVVYLVRSLGGKSSIERKKRIGGGIIGGYKSKRNELDVRVSHCGNFNPFLMPRKKIRVKDATYKKRYISKIEKLGKQETICFSVAHESRLFVVDGFVVTHNTRLGCYLAIYIAERYPNSRGVIGRKELKTLRLTTLNTLWEIFAELGYKKDEGYKYNAQDGVLTFENGSEILILDTAHSPQDPEFTRFGSLELTWAWIDESAETPLKAKQILKTRVGRKNKLNGEEVKPFWLETFNPDKGHVYNDYYKPYKEETMPEHRRFVRALATDNPHIPEEYIDNLKRADKVTKERLLYGNFEYDDDPAKLFEYDAVVDLFTNTVENGKKYLSADIARFGEDKTVIGIWDGYECKKIILLERLDLNSQAERIKDLMREYKIPYSHAILDEDGVGGGVIDNLKGVRGFMGNSSPFQIWDGRKQQLVNANFKNLRSQCYFKLSDLVNTHKIAVRCQDANIRDRIQTELEAIKQKDPYRDTKNAIIPKKDINEALGFSPDYADMLMMRMFFEFITKAKTTAKTNRLINLPRKTIEIHKNTSYE